MVFEKVMPAARLPEMGRGAACRAYDLAQSLNVIHRHYRRIDGQDHCVFDEDRYPRLFTAHSFKFPL